MKVVAIIQARMGSTRLPGKVLMQLAGVPVIQMVYNRASQIPLLNNVILATTTSKLDDKLAEYCLKEKIPVFRGSEEDVLDRYIQAGIQYEADIVIRLTADCPFIDPHISGEVLRLFLETPNCDYATNCFPRTYPDGLDTGVVRFSTLKWVWKITEEGPYREHVTLYITHHPQKFIIGNYANKANLSYHRWTLDEPEDYRFLSLIAEKLQFRGQFGYLEEILTILNEQPSLTRINGYLQSNEYSKRSWKKWLTRQQSNRGNNE